MTGIVTCMNSVAHHKHEFDVLYTESNIYVESEKHMNLSENLRIPEITVLILRPWIHLLRSQ